MNLKTELSWKILLTITILCYGFAYLLGGIIGSALGTIGLLTLLFTPVAFFRERGRSKN